MSSTMGAVIESLSTLEKPGVARNVSGGWAPPPSRELRALKLPLQQWNSSRLHGCGRNVQDLHPGKQLRTLVR